MSKCFLKSKTVQGVLTMLTPLLMQLFGIEIGDAETTQIAEAVAVLLGAVWAIVGRAKAQGGLHLFRARASGRANRELAAGLGVVVLVALILVPLSLSGCAAWQKATPVEKARIVGVEGSKQYLKLYGEYQAAYPSVTEEGRAFMDAKVAPALDAAKRALILYNDAASVWSRTGEEPEEMEDLDRSLRRLLVDAGTLLTEAATKYLSKEE